MCGKKDRPISEYRRDASLAVSNAATAGQRLLSEPPNRRGDVESSLAAVNYCRRILHALAAISDYPTREPIQLESDDLTRLIEALAKALDDLAASLKKGTDPGRLADSSENPGTAGKGSADSPARFPKGIRRTCRKSKKQRGWSGAVLSP